MCIRDSSMACPSYRNSTAGILLHVWSCLLYTSKSGYATNFTVTACEPLRYWAFIMENDNMSGSWEGIFEAAEGGTQPVSYTHLVFSWWTWYICKENYKNVECLLRHSTFFNIRDAYSFRLSTQVFSSAALSLPLSIRPSMILAPGALERSPEADLPRPLPPEVDVYKRQL